MALQGIPSELTGRARAARRAKDMLDLLDELRDGMLAGDVSRSTLDQLTTLTRAREEDFVDPELSALVSEIELRALVELAKLDVAAARQA